VPVASGLEDDCGFVFRRKAPKLSAAPVTSSQKTTITAEEMPKPNVANVVKPVATKKTVVKKVAERAAPAPIVAAAPVEPAESVGVTPSKRQLLERQRRRSSLPGLGAAVSAGRRRSSIGAGVGFTHDMPPAGVEPEQYHRHILPDLPGPLKMKQLLIWAVRLAAQEMAEASPKDSKDSSTSTQWEELVTEPLTQGLHTNGLCVSWYQRPSTGTTSGSQTMMRANPVNVDMRECHGLYQRYTRQLQAELSRWKAAEASGAPHSFGDVSSSPSANNLTALLAHPSLLPSSAELGTACKWLHRLPFHLDRLGWLLHVAGSFEGRSRAYCEAVFHQIFERFFSHGQQNISSTSGTGAVAEVVPLLKALSKAS